VYPVHSVPSDVPAFINEESSHSLVYVAKADGAGKDYQIQVRETRNTVTKALQKTAVISRAAGSLLPLYVGYTEASTLTPTSTPPPTPTPALATPPPTPTPALATPPPTPTPGLATQPTPTVRPIQTPPPPTRPAAALQKLVSAFERINAAPTGSAKEEATTELISLLRRDQIVEQEFHNFRNSLEMALARGDISREKANQFTVILQTVERRLESQRPTPQPTSAPTSSPPQASPTPVTGPTSAPPGPVATRTPSSHRGGGCFAPANGLKVVELGWVLLGLVLPGWLLWAKRRGW
jgi:hypothetical protein